MNVLLLSAAMLVGQPLYRPFDKTPAEAPKVTKTDCGCSVGGPCLCGSSCQCAPAAKTSRVDCGCSLGGICRCGSSCQCEGGLRRTKLTYSQLCEKAFNENRPLIIFVNMKPTELPAKALSYSTDSFEGDSTPRIIVSVPDERAQGMAWMATPTGWSLTPDASVRDMAAVIHQTFRRATAPATPVSTTTNC